MNEGSLKYVLDANVFMEAARRYYPFDFAEPFWNGLLKFGEEGKLCSIDRVYDEIKKGDDKLKTWAGKDFSNCFLATQEGDVLESYAKLVQWAQSQSQYQQRAKDVFMEERNADTWVLAYALAKNIKIVTHEGYSANAQKRILIPNVCVEFGIRYCDTFEMLKELKFKF